MHPYYYKNFQILCPIRTGRGGRGKLAARKYFPRLLSGQLSCPHIRPQQRNACLGVALLLNRTTRLGQICKTTRRQTLLVLDTWAELAYIFV